MNGQIQLYAATTAGGVRWRLLSGNNRESARSAHGYSGAEHCLAAVSRVRHERAELALKVRRADAYRWVWEVALGGETVAVSGHRFDRMIRCELAATQFLDALPYAAIRDGVVITARRRFPGAVR